MGVAVFWWYVTYAAPPVPAAGFWLGNRPSQNTTTGVFLMGTS